MLSLPSSGNGVPVPYILPCATIIWIALIANVRSGGEMKWTSWVKLSMRSTRVAGNWLSKAFMNWWIGNGRMGLLPLRFHRLTGVKSCLCKCSPLSDGMDFIHRHFIVVIIHLFLTFMREWKNTCMKCGRWMRRDFLFPVPVTGIGATGGLTLTWKFLLLVGIIWLLRLRKNSHFIYINKTMPIG